MKWIRHTLRRLHQRLLRDTLGLTQHKRLVSYIAPLLPDAPVRILDIGAGSGLFSHLLMQARPSAHITAVEVYPRPQCFVDVQMYDGVHLPFPDKHFDYALLINVLHHALQRENLLAEARRVSRKGIIIKDHYANTPLDYHTLVLMEKIGNAFLKIDQPHNFLSEQEWKFLFSSTGLKTEQLLTKFVSYNAFIDLFFGRNMHFIALLTPWRKSHERASLL